MSTERENRNPQEIGLKKAIDYSRGFPNLGGVPDISLSALSVIAQTSKVEKTKKPKSAEEQKSYTWGFYSAMKRWLDGKLED